MTYGNIIHTITGRQRLLPLGRACCGLLLLLLTACEKEIPIDYRDAAGLYAAEAVLTQKECTVRLSTTQSVTDNSTADHNIADATVVLSSEGEVLDTLKYGADGVYKSAIGGMAGFVYDLDIYVGDRHFHSSSTMQEEPQLSSFRFVWKKFFSERMLFAQLRIDDKPRQQNYYFMHIYRNRVGYRWAVTTDEGNPGGELQQLFSCTTERQMDNNDEDALRDGDQIRLEVRAIDRLSYDYLYSMQVMDNSGSNPIANFSGGCLGYFSACHVVTRNYTFRTADVEEE